MAGHSRSKDGSLPLAHARPSTPILATGREERRGCPRQARALTWRGQGQRPGMMSRATSLLGLAGVLDGLECLELDVVEFTVDLLDLADVDVLHDVAGFRIDRDRAARAFPLRPLHGLDQRIAVGLTAGLLQRLVDQMNSVIAAYRHEAGPVAEGLLVGGD